MNPMLSLNQVRAQVAAIRKRKPDASVIGLQSPARWQGDSETEIEGTRYWLRSAETELEMRAVLAEPRPADTNIVVLTNLQTEQIGEDVLAQFARQRFHALSASEVLKELFQARDVDPRLQQLKWLATALVDAQPAVGYPPVPQGALDQETAWGCYLDRLLDLRPARPDLVGLLAWANTPSSTQRWHRQSIEAKQAVQRWIEPSVGPALGAVVAALDASSGESIVCLGLVAGVLFDRTHIPTEIATARGKFERYFGDRHLEPESAKALATAARQWLDLADTTATAARAEIERADTVLCDLRIDNRALDSKVSLLGFEQRLALFGRAVGAFLRKPTAEGITELTEHHRRISDHRAAKDASDRVERVGMALRLCRWISTAGSVRDHQGFAPLAEDYVTEGCFVDWARLLLFHGDSQPDLNQAFAELTDTIGTRREAMNRTFASALEEWTELGRSSSDLLVIEDVLTERVATVAMHERVLVLVLDGMSYPVYRQLMDSLVREGWAEALPPNTTKAIPVVAGLPTITEWSRRLLLSGRADITAGEDEAAAFRDSPALARVTRPSHPPTLFRKGELTEANTRSLAEEVRKKIGSPNHQVVGVIINAIDDHLTKDDQLHVGWSPSRVPLLQQLLGLARESGRVVILTSDHGHIIAHNSRLLRSASSDRFRGPDGNLAPEELHLSKGRAAAFAREGFVAPWSERCYYTTKRNGFHGGLTPQEVLVPATVLVSGEVPPDGWSLVAQTAPNWWWSEPATVAPVPPPTPAAPPRKGKKATSDLNTLPLFATETTPVQTWVDTLLSSQIYLEQYRRAGRTAPPNETVRKVLCALDERNGTLLKAALAQRLGEPEFRINGMLAILRRILNIEGYQVLQVDESSGTIQLDRGLLRTQFELP